MDVRLFLLVSLGAALLALLTRADRRLSVAIGLLGLAGCITTGLLIDDVAVAGLPGGSLAGSAFLRWFLVLASTAGLVACLVTLAVHWLPDLPAVTLASLGASALALSLVELPVAFVAATGAGALALISLADPRSEPGGTRTTLTYLQVLVAAGALAVVASAWLTDRSGALNFDSIAGGGAALAMALALAVRLGALPFHAPNARLMRAVAHAGLPLLLGSLPVVFFLVALTWSQRVLQPQGIDLGPFGLLVAAVGAGSLLLGALGAFGRPPESDDLQHIVSYGIVQDAGLFLLAFAAFDPATWEPARAWSLYFVVSKTALGAWMAALIAVRGSAMVGHLEGWVRGNPLLAIALLGALAAGLGIPGLGSWDARRAIIDSVAEPALVWIAYAGWFLAYVPLIRLLWVGLRSAGPPLPEPEGVRLHFPTMPASIHDVRSMAAYAAATVRLSRLAIGVVLACAVGLGAAVLAFAPAGLEEAAATLPEPLLPDVSPIP